MATATCGAVPPLAASIMWARTSAIAAVTGALLFWGRSQKQELDLAQACAASLASSTKSCRQPAPGRMAAQAICMRQVQLKSSAQQLLQPSACVKCSSSQACSSC